MKELKTVDIKGKSYVMVNERIKAFRENFEGWSLTSEIISLEDGIVTMRASVIDENGVLRATGHAQEKETSSFINKTSYIENCETSAWGRALGNLGIGIDESIATYEEVGNAIRQQSDVESEEKTKANELIMAFAEVAGIIGKDATYERIGYNKSQLTALTQKSASEIQEAIDKIAKVKAEL